jgi:hypothetical protein
LELLFATKSHRSVLWLELCIDEITIGALTKSNEFEESVDIFILVLTLQISKELVGEQLLSENNLLGATVHKEYEKDGGELRPSHFVLSAFDHGKADSGNTGSVTEFRLRQIKHLAKRNEIVCKSFFALFDFFFRKRYHIGIVFHFNTSLYW